MPTNVKRSRRRYILAIVLMTILGLPARLIPQQYLPAFYVNYAGDALWALMIFLLLGLFFPRARTRTLLLIALAIAYGIEFSELYQAEWINNLRSIKIIGLILGYTFLWSDLVSYTAGILVGVLLEHYVLLNSRGLRLQTDSHH
jgi:hypothetical protein